jgi:hypothetical protein
LEKITNLEGVVRHNVMTFSMVRKCLQQEDYLRAYALASDDEHDDLKDFVTTNEVAKELALVYRMLNVERNYTDELTKAANRRDYLRVAALCADHHDEQIAHDKMLTRWSKDHGFTRSLRDEFDQTIV